MASLNSDDSSTNMDSQSSTPGETSSSSEQQEKFTQKETRNVFLLRLLVISVIFLAACAVSYVVFTITKRGETEEYNIQFEGTASKVLDAFEGIVTQKLDAVTSLSVAATAHSVDHFKEWPFLTLSSFQERSEATRKQSETLFTSIAPVVTHEKREEWENYTITDPYLWVGEALAHQSNWDMINLGVDLPTHVGEVHPGYILQDDFELGRIRDESYGPYFPIWETSPLLKGQVNFNLASLPQWRTEMETTVDTQSIVIGRMLTPPVGTPLHGDFLTRFFATILSIEEGKSTTYEGDPFSYVFFPIFNSFEKDKKTAAVLFTVINWALFFENLLPPNIKGISVVLENGCDGPVTYTVNGGTVVYEGKGDLHDKSHTNMERTTTFKKLEDRTREENDVSYNLETKECPYSIRVYPSQAFYDHYNTSTPATITISVVMVFVFTMFMFLVYDRLVEFRQRLILRQAVKSSSILSSLFPRNIRDRLMEDADAGSANKKSDFMAPNHRLKSFLTGDDKAKNDMGAQPIADLFPHATVLFADIAGFTAWSSSREPSQVFILLQGVYQAFDSLAKRRRVFKVETIGDSYVAVTGLPEPQDQHAVIMANFAKDCLVRMKQVTRQLEVVLGPDTGDLAMRFGMHSGPVTAGVLRGERSRFQLFGDTVNTAARMESTGQRNKIQVSQKTADLLIAAGKGHWLNPREDAVNAKGKGVLNTHWLVTTTKRHLCSALAASDASGSNSGGDLSDVESNSSSNALSESNETLVKHERMVDWIVEVILPYIKKVSAQRSAKKKTSKKVLPQDFSITNAGANLEEVTEIIDLPQFDAKAAAKARDHRDVDIDPVVVEQLRQYVAIIASTYRDNPFHNFQHACHVTMAVNKFLQRIVAPDLDLVDIERAKNNTGSLASHLHDYTHGINSDPLTLCAIVFSALIHDVDHRGISNVQLGKEDEKMAALYQNKSIAEQNSLDISWGLFTSDEFTDLRQFLFADESEFRRFRQVIVNVVLATDILDKELNDLRKARWEKAFNEDLKDDAVDTNGLRATIVIEHIIQASDVSHTMQHWHVYRKWNKCLFQEMTEAYRAGRMGSDPALFWYKGELGFFDNYIIPLAKKLKDCNVFGVSSDECLNYALQNRAEWEERGEALVAEMLEEMRHEVSFVLDDKDRVKGNELL